MTTGSVPSTMDADYWIGELSRLYERSSEAIREEQGKAIEPLTEDFNEALEKLKDAFPDNEIVSATDPVNARTEGVSESTRRTVAFAPSRHREEALYEVRSRCEKMANALNYELPERDSVSQQNDQMVMVTVDQTSKQEVNQEVTVESIMELIDADPTVQGDKGDLKDLVEEFEAELSKDDVDGGQLRQFVQKAKDYSTSIAAKMSIRALQAGAVGVLGL